MQPDELEGLITHDTQFFDAIATVTREPFAWFLDSAVLPGYHDANRAVRLRDDGRGPSAVVREVLTHYRRRGLKVVADVDAIAERQGIGAALRRAYITPLIDDLTTMRYDRPNPPPAVPGVEVQMIPGMPDETVARVWVETAICDDRDTENMSMWRTVLEYEAHNPLCTLYLGFLDGKPAGACDLFSAAGWGRIESVATCPAFRRRGVARAVVSAAVKQSHVLGNRITYLNVAPRSAAEALYTGIGFEIWSRNAIRRHIGR